MKILLIDDDEALGEALDMYLKGFQHQVVFATRPSVAFDIIEHEKPDLILLDLMLPEQDGLSVCIDIRMSNKPYKDIPIVMLTARGDVSDRVVGLEIGADDYLPKPFEPRELLARISSVMRRHSKSMMKEQSEHQSNERKKSSGLYIDTDRRQVWMNNNIIELSTMEYELLTLLSTTPGKKWSRDELTSKLRGTNSELYSRAVDTLVSRLRQRLGDVSKPPKYIQTVWGYGYCFLRQNNEKA